MNTTRVIRIFLLFEAATFVAAAMVHFGVFIQGYEHRQAGTAESVIAVVLLTGLAMTGIGRTSARSMGPGTQTFALLGTLVGVFTIAIGVGPRTVPDIAYHIGIIGVLVWGLFVAQRARPDVAGRPA